MNADLMNLITKYHVGSYELPPFQNLSAFGSVELYLQIRVRVAVSDLTAIRMGNFFSICI